MNLWSTFLDLDKLHESTDEKWWTDQALDELKNKPKSEWTEDDWDTYHYCKNANAERDYYDSLDEDFYDFSPTSTSSWVKMPPANNQAQVSQPAKQASVYVVSTRKAADLQQTDFCEFEQGDVWYGAVEYVDKLTSGTGHFDSLYDAVAAAKKNNKSFDFFIYEYDASANKLTLVGKVDKAASQPATPSAKQPAKASTAPNKPIVTIVKDSGKLRALAANGDGQGNPAAFVQFPTALRTNEGQQYEVDQLVWTGKFYRVSGNISPIITNVAASTTSTQNITENINKENSKMNFNSVFEELNKLYENKAVTKETDKLCSVVFDGDQQMFTGTKEECEKWIKSKNGANASRFSIKNSATINVVEEGCHKKALKEDWYGADTEVEFDESVYSDIAKYFGLTENDKVYYAYYFLDEVTVNYTDAKGQDQEIEKHVPIGQVEEWFKAGYYITEATKKALKENDEFAVFEAESLGEKIKVAKKDFALAKRLDKKASNIWIKETDREADEEYLCKKYGVQDFSGVELFDKFAIAAGLTWDLVEEEALKEEPVEEGLMDKVKSVFKKGSADNGTTKWTVIDKTGKTVLNNVSEEEAQEYVKKQPSENNYNLVPIKEALGDDEIEFAEEPVDVIPEEETEEVAADEEILEEDVNTVEEFLKSLGEYDGDLKLEFKPIVIDGKEYSINNILWSDEEEGKLVAEFVIDMPEEEEVEESLNEKFNGHIENVEELKAELLKRLPESGVWDGLGKKDELHCSMPGDLGINKISSIVQSVIAASVLQAEVKVTPAMGTKENWVNIAITGIKEDPAAMQAFD